MWHCKTSHGQITSGEFHETYCDNEGYGRDDLTIIEELLKSLKFARGLLLRHRIVNRVLSNSIRSAVDLQRREQT